MRKNRPMSFSAQVIAALDPLLLPAGFARGQMAGDDERVIYCAAHDEFSERFPALPQANQQLDLDGACVDLELDFEVGIAAELEGLSLRETFLALGLEREAAEAASWENASRGEALNGLPGLLTRLLEVGSAGVRGA